ncbi:hypothetical protein PILCRDRAFT_1439 [Piloderma croceum F 1598]|uniref:Uncharacterized protein n=1 Tax=Piloderma croceum (strain F 1598) TaxID=765440 RepID=A0A0C3G4T7_PILCF|nr:hypothetical protein PILCRDRAFT_1439 [Piloderma croceum F 1598]
MAKDDAFGFLDPSDVLRGSHIVPAFAKGKLHPDGKGLLHLAQDSSDWIEYYVNRYHSGLGVGHVYGHRSASNDLGHQFAGSATRMDNVEEEFVLQIPGNDYTPSSMGETFELEFEGLGSEHSSDFRDDNGGSEDDKEETLSEEEFIIEQEMYG